METENKTPAELRKDAYESCLTVEFPAGSGKLVTFDDAAKMYNSYHAVGDAATAAYLQEQLIDAKRRIKEMFPDTGESRSYE